MNEGNYNIDGSYLYYTTQNVIANIGRVCELAPFRFSQIPTTELLH